MQRSAGLDLMRAVAISLVLLDHFLPRLGFAAPEILRFIGWSPIGVDLFFALSGFLIGRILLRLGSQISEPRALFGFWIRRWLRTLPVYYVMLFLRFFVVVMGSFHFGWGTLAILPSYLVFMQCWAWPVRPISGPYVFFGEAWSLAVEEWFYLLFPLLLAGMVYVGIKPVRAFLFASIIMLLASVGFRLGLEPAEPRNWFTDIYNVTIYRFDSIAWGLIAAVFSVTRASLWFRMRWMALVLGLALLGFDHQYQMLHLVMNQYWRVWHFTITGVGSALVLPWCSTVPNFYWRPLQSLTGVIARWSYSLYLVHYMFITLALRWVVPHLKESTGLNCGLVVVTCGCSFAFAGFLYHWVEKPMMNLRERWTLSKQLRMKEPKNGPTEVAAI
jgi:peptidoglycan/LPS O-acetylase OafA/YrhL